MPLKSPSVRLLSSTGLAALALLAPCLHGQSAPAANPAGKPDDAIELPAFSVASSKVTGYRAANSISATGIDMDIIDTPIAINVLTGEFLADTSAFELRQAMDFVPGVRTAENNESRFRVRGFTALSALRNGHFRRQLFPTWNIDRVEVIKGATAIFHGSNRPGGIINYLTRRPSFEAAGEAKMMVGSYEHVRGELNYTGPIGEHFAYRLGLGSYTAGGFRDFWHNRGSYAGAAFTVRPTQRMEITLDYEHITQNISDQQSTDLFTNNAQNALAPIYPLNDPTGYRYNLGGPDSFRKYSSTALDLDTKVQLAENLFYRLEGNFAEDNFAVLRSTGNRENAGTTAGTVTLRFTNAANYRDSWDIKNSLTWKVEAGDMKHVIMLGQQANEVRQRTPGFGRKNGRQGPQFRYNPTTGAFPEFPTLAPQYPLDAFALLERIGTRTGDGAWNDNRRVKGTTNAFYLIDSVDLMAGRLKVVGGARYNRLREILYWDSLPTVAPLDNIDQNRVTPQFGALYKFNNHLSAFVSYSESLESQNALDADGQTSGPIEGIGYEAGLKAEALDNKLSGTLSVFQVERANTASRDTARELREGREPFFFFGNTETSAGFEADLAYNPLSTWQVLVSYAWLWQREVTAAQDPARIGTIFEQTPEHALNVWNKYNFATGSLKGLEIGGGVRWDSGYLVNPLIESDASYRIDAMLRYPLTVFGRRVLATLNVNNVTDRQNLGGSINWASPREYYFSLSTKF